VTTSTIKLSLERQRKLGYKCDVTEKWKPASPKGFKGPLVRKDLFNFIDIICIHDGVTYGAVKIPYGFLAIQATSYAAMSARFKKIQKEPMTTYWLAAGGRIEIHGWGKVGGRWVCKVRTYPEQQKERT
jgi:hypothetical protein